jgi:hypothetical protein
MRNTSGVVWVSQDPREYRTMNYYSHEPKLRSMQPWITGVTHITRWVVWNYFDDKPVH